MKRPRNVKTTILFLNNMSNEKPDNFTEVITWAKSHVEKIQVVHLRDGLASACGTYREDHCNRINLGTRPLTYKLDDVTCTACQGTVRYRIGVDLLINPSPPHIKQPSDWDW